MLAIPELFWSIELSKELDANQLYEELVMQLFNLLTEVEERHLPLFHTLMLVKPL